MNFEKHVITELKCINDKLDIVQESTARQDERIKQNTKNIDSQKKKIWGAVIAALSAIVTIIVNIFR